MSKPDLHGRTILVTGASTGIGLAVSRELADRRARIIGVARNSDRLESAIEQLPGSDHLARAMDVSDQVAWPRLARGLEEIGARPDGLVTAAAVLDPIGPTASVDPADVLKTLQVNLWGTFLAIHHLLPGLVAAGDGAVVTFSGGGATGPFPRYDAYAMSKAGVVRLTENVAADVPEVRVNAVAPGFIATDIHRTTLSAGEDLAGADYLRRTREQLQDGGASIERAAALVALLLGPEAEGISGKLISAPWDAWDDADFRTRLASEPDLCSLRRIDGVFFGPFERSSR